MQPYIFHMVRILESKAFYNFTFFCHYFQFVTASFVTKLFFNSSNLWQKYAFTSFNNKWSFVLINLPILIYYSVETTSDLIVHAIDKLRNHCVISFALYIGDIIAFINCKYHKCCRGWKCYYGKFNILKLIEPKVFACSICNMCNL